MRPKARYCIIAAHKKFADFSSEYVKRVTLFKTPLKKVGLRDILDMLITYLSIV